jgi:hypothetical protein
MKILLTLLLTCLAVHAATERGVSFDPDTLIVTQTNLTQTFNTVNSEIVNVIDEVNVGVAGEAGLIQLSSTNSNWTSTTSLDTNGTWHFFGDVYDDYASGPAFRIDTISNLTSSAIIDFALAGTPVAEIYRNGYIYAQGLYVSAPFNGASEYMEMDPGADMTLVNGTNDVVMEFQTTNGAITFTHDSTNFFHMVGINSGYTGAGTLVLTDDGTYKSISGVGGGGGNAFTTGTAAAGNVAIYTTGNTNIVPTSAMTVTGTNVSITGTLSLDSIVITNSATFGGSSIVTANSTNTFTNKTIDTGGTGNVFIQKRQLTLFRFPDMVDGTGCTYANTNNPYSTSRDFMRPVFSASGATNANYCQFSCLVPDDWTSGTDPTASIKVQLGGADTDLSTYTVGMVSVANSASGSGATPANYVTLTVPADGSGGSGDVEGVSGVTLTGWGAAATAGQWLLIQLQRDGSDASAVAEALLALEITYTSTQ